MDVFQLLYHDVSDPYCENYQKTGDFYCLGVFSSEEKARCAMKADLLDEAGAGGFLASREDVPDAEEGMVRVVDGVPRGFYEIHKFPLDKLCWKEMSSGMFA